MNKFFKLTTLFLLGFGIIACTTESSTNKTDNHPEDHEPSVEDNYEGYLTLSVGDIIVMAAPKSGMTASLDNSGMKLNATSSTFSSNYSSITSLGDGTAEFILSGEKEKFTLEAQNNKYLAGTNVKKVTFVNTAKGNIYWDIHANYDLRDGVVIENSVESIGYFMYNISENYFTTYHNQSILQGAMELPSIYKLCVEE